jgi:hypothetical protein
MSVFDIPTNTWTHGGAAAPNAGLARSASGGGTAFGKHYAIGGATNSGPTAAVEQFDPSTQTWTMRASMSVARAALGVATLNDKIFAIGGSTTGNYYSPGTIFNTNEVYDPLTNIWTVLTPMPVAVSFNTATVGYNGKIYVIGGLTAVGGTSLVQIYDVTAGTWTTGTPMPTARLNAMAGVLNGQIVVFGGSFPLFYYPSGAISSFSVSDLTEIYDPLSDTWTFGPLMYEFGDGFGQGVTFNNSQVFAASNTFNTYCTCGASKVQVLDSSTDPQPTITSISQTSGAQGSTVSATIIGANFTGATSVVFSGSGVTATIGSGGTATTLSVTITIASGAAPTLRYFSVNTLTGTTRLFNGFTVTPGVIKRRGQITSQ